MHNITDSEYQGFIGPGSTSISRASNVSTNWPEISRPAGTGPRFCSPSGGTCTANSMSGHRGLRVSFVPYLNFAVMIASAWPGTTCTTARPGRTSRASRRPFRKRHHRGLRRDRRGAPLGDLVGIVVSLLFLVLAFALGLIGAMVAD
jgi:hypothetical protein